MGMRLSLFSCALLCVAANSLISSHGAESSLHRIAFGSCFNPHEGGSMWKLIKSFDPNHLVLLGDQIYVDKEENFAIDNVPSIIKEQYDLFLSNKEFQELKDGLDTWSVVYDDHDYGKDNADKHFPPRRASQRLFWEFASSSLPNSAPEPKTEGLTVASTDPDFLERDGVYSSKTVSLNTTEILEHNGGRPFKFKVILMDSRSNKDKLGTVDGDFLGPQQWAWLSEQLEDPEPDLVVLGSSILALSDDKPVEEMWSEFPAARERLLALATAASFTKDVVFLSGDIHRAEVSRAECSLKHRDESMEHTANFWEFTSSGLGHTFIEKVDPDEADSTAEGLLLPVVSRGWIPRTLDWFYQAIYPGLYRENGRNDGYSGVHFSLMDIKVNASTDSGKSSNLYLELEVIAASGKPVIQKVVPLRKFDHRLGENEIDQRCPQCGLVFDAFRSLSLNHTIERGSTDFDLESSTGPTTHISCTTGGGSDEECYVGCSGSACLDVANDSNLRIPSLFEATDGEVILQCTPYWGYSFTRIVFFRAAVATLLLVGVVLPLLTAAWFIGASIWYLWMRKEWKRRERIERNYQAAKKKEE